MANVTSPRRRDRVVERHSILRASILDTALELGIADSSTVAKWMFNPVQEVDEDAESVASPSLTYASTATSDDSSFRDSGPQCARNRWPVAGASVSTSVASQSHSSATSDFSFDSPSLTRADGFPPTSLSSGSTSQRAIHFSFDNPAPSEPRVTSPTPTPAKPGKLRKPRTGSSENDAGYISDGTGSKKDKKSKSKKKSKADGDIPEEESDGGYLSEFSFRRKKEKKQSKKDKESEKKQTDGESDGGFISAFSSRNKKERNAAKTTPPTRSSTPGDDSDGAYLSETSVKKRNKFFRLPGRSSRKKSNASEAPPEVPPVPALPPMELKIADMFPSSMSRALDNPSPALTVTKRQMEAETSSLTASISSSEPPPSLRISESTGADNSIAESIRSRSTDSSGNSIRRPMESLAFPSLNNPAPADASAPTSTPESHTSPKAPPILMPTLPIIAPLRTKNSPVVKAPPATSAPNTRPIASKHAPTPLVLTPPTPVNSLFPTKASMPPPSERSATPISAPLLSAASNTRSASPSLTKPRSPSPSPTVQSSIRPHVLAYYDLPPPSPPPTGPLPRTPLAVDTQIRAPRHEWSQHPRAPSPIWKTDRTSTGSNSTNPTTPTTPQPSSATSPLFLKRIPSNQRLREPPFPVQPVRSREDPANLAPKPSAATQWDTSASGTRLHRVGTRTVNISSPMSADAVIDRRVPQQQQNLDIHWQPRSASALDTRPPIEEDDSRRSWIEYDDGVSFSSHRESTEEDEQQDGQEEEAESVDLDDEQDASAIIRSRLRCDSEGEGEGRATHYFDAEDSDAEGDNRYSVWSAKSRVSILDKERSGNVRQKFVKQVEAMYGKHVIPPVPKLPPSARS